MKAAHRHIRAAFVATVILGGRLDSVDASGPNQLSGLLSNSPFGKSAVLTNASVTEGGLEFRAVLEEENGLYFSLFEVSPKRSTWVGMNERINEIILREYDAGKMTIGVEYNGRSLTLPLKGGKRLPWTMASTPATAPRRKPDDGSSFYDRPFRIGHVAEEMKIREAVRRQAKALTDMP